MSKRKASKPGDMPEDVPVGGEFAELAEEVVFRVEPAEPQPQQPAVVQPPAGQVQASPLGSLDVVIPEGFYEGLVGTVTNALIRAFPGIGTNAIVVEITGDDGKKYSETLWLREIVGRKSKLGAFVVALGRDLGGWIGKRVRIVSWKSGNRVVEVIG